MEDQETETKHWLFCCTFKHSWGGQVKDSANKSPPVWISCSNFSMKHLLWLLCCHFLPSPHANALIHSKNRPLPLPFTRILISGVASTICAVAKSSLILQYVWFICGLNAVEPKYFHHSGGVIIYSRHSDKLTTLYAGYMTHLKLHKTLQSSAYLTHFTFRRFGFISQPRDLLSSLSFIVVFLSLPLAKPV
jgi:hypothetical protein